MSNFKTKFAAVAVAATIALSPFTAKAETFNGFYAGAATGWFHKRADTGSKKHTFNQMPLELHLGYVSSSPNCFLWGIEAALGYAFFSKKSAINTTLNVEHKTKFFTELAAKFGWNFTNFAAYLIAGVSGHQAEVKFSSATGSTSDKDFIFGVFPGVGFAYKFDDNWSLRGEYKWHFQKSVKAASRDVKFQTHDFRIGVDYAF